MSNLSYTFTEGQIVELFHGVPHDAWDIYSVPDEVLIRALEWNDSNGDFEGLERLRLLEVFLADFIVSKTEPTAKNEYVTKVATVNTGGHCMVDFVHLWDGRVITLNDECLCVFKSPDAFWDDQGDSAELAHYFKSGN
jgi:hypothetical protein